MLRQAWNWLNHYTNRPWTIIFATHLLGLPAIYFLLTQFAWWMLPAIWVMWFIFGGIGAEIGLHRLWSHRSFALTGPIRWFVAWCSVMAIQDTPFFWAILHRGVHHPNADKAGDLHSPVHGWWHAYMGWMFKPKQLEAKMSVVRDLVRDPMHRWIGKHYTTVYWTSIAVSLLLLGPVLTCILLIIPSLLALHQESLVNLFCHLQLPLLSYRNHSTGDRSTNNWLLSWLAPWGLFLHNNHHGKPNRYHFDERWFEIDVCRWVVPALVFLDKRASL